MTSEFLDPPLIDDGLSEDGPCWLSLQLVYSLTYNDEDEVD